MRASGSRQVAAIGAIACGVAALGAAIVALAREHALWRIAVVVLLGLGASALTRVALGASPSTLHAQAPPGMRVAAATRPVLIANPRSGGGKANESFLAEARARGVETVVLRPGDDFVQLARDAIAAGADVIGVAGGDGSQALALETAGRGAAFTGWHEWKDVSLVIRSSRRIEAGVDGEALTLDPPVRFEMRPGALRVRIAPSHPGVSPAAIAGTVRRSGPRRLLRVASGRDAG